jgi:hypothetical protein
LKQAYLSQISITGKEIDQQFLVHLTSNASRVAARKLMASGGEEGEPVNKRARLESVVPCPAPAKKKNVATGQPPTSPTTRPVPPPPPL